MRDIPREVMWEIIHDMSMDECTVMAKQAGVKCVFEGEYEGFPACDECVDKLCDWLYDDGPLVCHCDNLKEAVAIASKGKLRYWLHDDDPIIASTMASKDKLCQNKFEKAADLFEEAIKEHGYGSLQCKNQLLRMMEAANVLEDKEDSRVPIRSYGCANMAKGLTFDILNRQIYYGKEPLDLSELAKLALTFLEEDYIYSCEERTKNIESIVQPFLHRIGKMEIAPDLMWDVEEKEFVDDVFTPLTYAEAATSLFAYDTENAYSSPEIISDSAKSIEEAYAKYLFGSIPKQLSKTPIRETDSKLDIVVKLFNEAIKDEQYGEEEVSAAIKQMLILAQTTK